MLGRDSVVEGFVVIGRCFPGSSFVVSDVWNESHWFAVVAPCAAVVCPWKLYICCFYCVLLSEYLDIACQWSNVVVAACPFLVLYPSCSVIFVM